jgi:hypothetical protein
VTTSGIDSEGFAALLPVREGAEQSVCEAVRGLSPGKESPFARLPGTLFARLILIPRLRDRHERELSEIPFCLFLAAEFDIATVRWLESLCASLPDDLERLFGFCAGYPGAGATEAFMSWMLEHRVPAGFSLHGYPQLSCERIEQSLELRERIIAFALETRGLEPAALSERWAQENWGEAR